MTMPDLTPQPYLQRNRVQRALRPWLIAAALCALAAVSAIAANQGQGPDPAAARATERLAQAQSRIQQSTQSAKSLDQQLKQQQRALTAQQHLTQRPDWSEVIRRVASRFDDELVMTGFQLGKAGDRGVGSALGPLSADMPEDSVWLIVSGVAEANKSVPGLILRLEDLGLFERVVMTGNQQEPFAGRARTGFTLACRVQ